MQLSNSVQQTVTTLTATDDAYISAGTAGSPAPASTNYGGASTINVGTSPTSNHANTAIALFQFQLPASVAGLTTALLQLTLASVPASSMVNIVLSPNCGPSQTWFEGSVTWSSASFIVLSNFSSGLSTAITSVSQNFVKMDPAEVTITGHLSAGVTGDAAGTLKSVDVTPFVASCAGSSYVTFAVVRRMRNSAYTGNTWGAIPADSLSNGAVASFCSKESTTTPCTGCAQPLASHPARAPISLCVFGARRMRPLG